MMTLRDNRSARRAGFSVIEMLVVIVIIGIASTVAVVSYASFRKDEAIRGAAEKVRSAIVQARTRAIANGQPTRVVFSISTQQIWIDELAPGTLFETQSMVVPAEIIHPNVLIEEVRLNGVTVSNGEANAVFLPDGTNALVTVNIRRQDSNPALDESYYSIQMYPTSADPKVWPHERK